MKHWKKILKEWTFVYNVRRGLPPDIPSELDVHRKRYPKLAIDHLSGDGLWEMARKLTLQQRAEVLGAPNGYEHLIFAPGENPKDVDKALAEGRFVLVQDLMSPINLRNVATAMAPGRPFGAPLWIRPTVGDLPWNVAAAEQAEIVEEAIRRSRDLLPRFSVFSFAQIPLALHLGFVLSDRVEVECYQYNRELNTWRWPNDAASTDKDIQVKGAPAKKLSKAGVAVVRVSLSAKIAQEDDPRGRRRGSRDRRLCEKAGCDVAAVARPAWRTRKQVSGCVANNPRPNAELPANSSLLCRADWRRGHARPADQSSNEPLCRYLRVLAAMDFAVSACSDARRGSSLIL